MYTKKKKNNQKELSLLYWKSWYDTWPVISNIALHSW